MRRFHTVLLLLFWSFLAMPQQSPSTYRGTWTATTGGTTYRGTWTGHTLPRLPNAARGTWAMVTETDRIVMNGTWSAEKTPDEWRGTFTADTRGRVFSGRWKADLGEAPGKTLQEMLQLAMQKEVGGAWDSGGRYGNWWLGPQ
jgi:hypothetical protein